MNLIKMKRMRKRSRMTQQELANIIGCSLSSIYKWESGNKPSPKMERLLVEYFKSKKRTWIG